ncbi:trichome birefringence-like 15-like protein [Drosera capensis]
MATRGLQHAGVCFIGIFEKESFAPRMQDKTIAFVGDSLGRQQFQSLVCMVTGGKESPDVEDVGFENGFATPLPLVEPVQVVGLFGFQEQTPLFYTTGLRAFVTWRP